MNQENSVNLSKSDVKKMGLKNLGICIGWIPVAFFLLSTGLWFEIRSDLMGIAELLSFDILLLETPLEIFAECLSFVILFGWILSLPSALIMSIFGVYPKFLKQYTFITPDQTNKTEYKGLVSDESTIDGVATLSTQEENEFLYIQIAGKQCHICNENIGYQADGVACTNCRRTFHKDCLENGTQCPECGAQL